MKFPQLTVDQKEYEKKLADLLNNPNCLLLFDTNILSQMYSLHADARAEFAAWLVSRKLDSTPSRVVLPAWCLHEYTNKVIRDRLRDYMPVGTTISATTNTSRQLMRHLAMSIDNKLAKGRNYDSRETYLQELEKAHESFIKLLPKPDNDEKTIYAIHEEIIAMFGDSAANSDIFSLLKTCQADYEMRFENNLPPGFLDVHKEKNKLGDYVIWREILELAKLKKASFFIYLSNDGKKDWVYTPPKVQLPSGEIVENTAKRNGYTIQLIDPRLDHELNLIVEGNAIIYLISFEQLVRQLTRQDELAFRQLAEAVQVNTQQKTRPKATATETPSKIVEVNSPPIPEPQTTPIAHAQPIPDQDTTPAATLAHPLFVYSATALADATYKVPQTVIGVIIDKLKSHNWHIQNDGIGELNNDELNAATADELFVLGRNILQAAVGSSFRAERYIENLSFYTTDLQQITAQHIVNGMLYEVYFDGQNEFRGSNGKAYYNRAFSKAIKDDHYLEASAHFIQHHLQPYEEFVLFIPFVKEYRHEVMLFFRAYHIKAFTDSILERCTIDDADISATVMGRVQDADSGRLRALGSYNYDLKILVQAICFSRYIPFTDEYVNLIYKLDGEQVEEEELGDYMVSSGLMV